MEKRVTDKEIMKNLVRHVKGKRFPGKHKVIEISDLYGIGAPSPCQIFESTEGTKNSRYFVTLQKRERTFSSYARLASQGIWKSLSKDRDIFDDRRRLMGCVRNLSYFCRGESAALRKTEWRMKEFHLTDNYVPKNQVQNENVIICILRKKRKKRRGYNPNEMEIAQSLHGLQLDQVQESSNASSFDDKTEMQIIQSLQGLQLQDTLISHFP